MKKIKITESQYSKLLEVAMDLDRYSQKPNVSTGSENKDIESSTEDMIQKLEELLSQFKTGKKVSTTQKMELHKVFDRINEIYTSITEIK
jgi:hypothetical protein